MPCRFIRDCAFASMILFGSAGCGRVVFIASSSGEGGGASDGSASSATGSATGPSTTATASSGTGAPLPNIRPVAVSATDFGWQSLQESFIKDGQPCHGAVTVVVGQATVCYASADNRLRCAGHLDGVDYGMHFVDAGFDGPVQVLLSYSSPPDGNSMCVLLDNGTMQCRGAINDQGQLGSSDTLAHDELVQWGGRDDIVRVADVDWQQVCALTTSGEVLCASPAGPTSVGMASTVSFSDLWEPVLDDPNVFRFADGAEWCRVIPDGLTCAGYPPRGTPGAVVAGGMMMSGIATECWLEASGNVWCIDAQTATTGPRFAPGAVISLAVSVDADDVCAVYADGSLHCFGSNYFGELGTGYPTPVLEEIEVAPPGSVRIDCH